MSSTIIWRDIKVDGKNAAFCNFGESGRLYVCERHAAVEAWVDHVKIGNYADMESAKAAALLEGGLAKPAAAPVKMQPSARAYTTTNPPPVADMSKPSTVVFVKPEPRVISTAAPIMAGHCKCGARLGRSGKCPALCEPVPAPLPVYTGPKFVGSTHIGRMAAPVSGWIGGNNA